MSDHPFVTPEPAPAPEPKSKPTAKIPLNVSLKPQAKRKQADIEAEELKLAQLAKLRADTRRLSDSIRHTKCQIRRKKFFAEHPKIEMVMRDLEYEREEKIAKAVPEDPDVIEKRVMKELQDKKKKEKEKKMVDEVRENELRKQLEERLAQEAKERAEKLLQQERAEKQKQQEQHKQKQQEFNKVIESAPAAPKTTRVKLGEKWI